MRFRIFTAALLAAMFLLLSGCVSGFIYTHVTLPLSTDMDRTPRGDKVCTVNSKHLEEPITGFDLSLQWDSRAIGDAARKAGMESLYYADMKTISVLGGLWKQQIVRVWGE
ncbi:MAG: hypothetical protein AB1724_08320 [Thermodesulfobacteriota bacterium]